MNRVNRYQAAILRDDHILLIKHSHHADGRSYWLLPGGGIEAGETEHECVVREVREETHLHVRVLRLLLESPDIPGGIYQNLRTYLCAVLDGEARPGYEPEEEAAQTYAITEVGWFDLRDAASWGGLIAADPITYPSLQRIQALLGYPAVRGTPAK